MVDVNVYKHFHMNHYCTYSLAQPDPPRPKREGLVE